LLQRRSIRLQVFQRFFFVAEQSASALHLARPEGRVALRIVLVTLPDVSRSFEHFLDGLDRAVQRSIHHIPG